MNDIDDTMEDLDSIYKNKYEENFKIVSLHSKSSYNESLNNYKIYGAYNIYIECSKSIRILRKN